MKRLWILFVISTFVIGNTRIDLNAELFKMKGNEFHVIPIRLLSVTSDSNEGDLFILNSNVSSNKDNIVRLLCGVTNLAVYRAKIIKVKLKREKITRLGEYDVYIWGAPRHLDISKIYKIGKGFTRGPCKFTQGDKNSENKEYNEFQLLDVNIKVGNAVSG